MSMPMTATIIQFRLRAAKEDSGFTNDELPLLYRALDIFKGRNVATGLDVFADDEGQGIASFFGHSPEPFLHILKVPGGYELRNTLWDLTASGSDLGFLLSHTTGDPELKTGT